MAWDQWRLRFREHLDLHRLPLTSLVDAVGATPGAISHWLTGRREINLNDFFRLCEAAGADPATILFGQDMATLARVRLDSVFGPKPAANPRYRAFERAIKTAKGPQAVAAKRKAKTRK